MEIKKVTEKDKLSPSSPYALSKKKCEEFIFNQNKLKRCNYIILRYFNVAGSPPNLETGLVTKKATHLIKKIMRICFGKKKNILYIWI